MNVFISWSGERSKAAALALRTWLPNVLQSVEPYMSSEDIDKGARWSTDIARRLEETSFGIVCVTRDNVTAPWLNFEAGALAKQFDASRVMPLLLDLAPSDVIGPLAQFQATLPIREDMTRLVLALNAAMPHPIDDPRILQTVELWWPRLDRTLVAIPATGAAPPARPQSEILAELLDLARSTQQQLAKHDEHARLADQTTRTEVTTGLERSTRTLELFVRNYLLAYGITTAEVDASGNRVLVLLDSPVERGTLTLLQDDFAAEGLEVRLLPPAPTRK